jgi:hypothetical protein
MLPLHGKNPPSLVAVEGAKVAVAALGQNSL